MNEARFKHVVTRIRALPNPCLLRIEGDPAGRTNDPDRPYIRKEQDLDAEMLEEILGARADEINVRVGMAVTRSGRTIAGVGALLLGSDPEAARRILAERTGGASINGIAAAMLEPRGMPAWATYQLLNGPNWGGNDAAWLTPEEIAGGMETIRDLVRRRRANADADPWLHVQRARLRTLSEEFEPARKTLARWAAHDAGEDDEEAEKVAEAIRAEYPESPIHSEAEIHPTAVIGSGCSVEKAVIECEVWIHPRCAIGSGTRIGPGSIVGSETVMGEKVTIGKGTGIGSRNRIAAGATVGDEARTADGVTVEANAEIGKHCSVGRGSTIGEGADVREAETDEEAVVGSGATVGPAARIGKRAVIGPNATVTRAEIPPGTIVAGRLHVRSPTEAGRYAIGCISE